MMTRLTGRYRVIRYDTRGYGRSPAPVAAYTQLRGAVAAFFRQGNYEQPDPPAYSRLEEVGVPSVLAIGDLDYPLMHECAERIAGRIPGCRLIVVPGADHLLPLRTPDALADIIGARVRGLG
jgi:pimeloyl-ACP methyl ester carboxylesterase